VVVERLQSGFHVRLILVRRTTAH